MTTDSRYNSNCKNIYQFIISISTNFNYCNLNGSDFSNANVGGVNTDAVASYDCTGVGFQSDLVFAWGSHTAGGGTNAYGDISHGVATRSDSVQMCTSHGDVDNVATTDVFGSISNAAILRNVLYGSITIGTFDAAGFTFTLPSRTYGMHICWLALKFAAGVSAKIKQENWAKASTGTQAFTGYGFKPNFLMAWNTAIASTAANDSSSDSSPFGIVGVNSDGDEFSNTLWSADAAADSNVKSLVSDSCSCFNETGTQSITWTLDTYDNDGYTLNFSSVETTTRYQIVLAIQVATSVATIVTFRRGVLGGVGNGIMRGLM